MLRPGNSIHAAPQYILSLLRFCFECPLIRLNQNTLCNYKLKSLQTLVGQAHQSVHIPNQPAHWPQTSLSDGVRLALASADTCSAIIGIVVLTVTLMVIAIMIDHT